MSKTQIKPDDKPLKDYYKSMKDLREAQNIQHEGGTRRAFGTLLSDIAKKQKWTLVEELSIKSSYSNRWIRVDGALRDQLRLARAYWEAKDSNDNLDAEIEKKKASGYPLKNIIFEDTETAVLYQDDHEAFRSEVRDQTKFARLLTLFFNYDRELFDNFEQAIESYKEEIPHIASMLKTKIEDAHQNNPKFKNQFADFMQLCQTSLNPNISREAVDEMLIQHLMTERIIGHVFRLERFTRDNVVAAKIEKVIAALTSQHFNRQGFLGALAPFYKAVESVADRQADFQAKQDFINTVYERFFQGYSVKVADTHGIVYTPQPIVDFMCAAVEEALETEFGRKLGDEGVILIDPATGTGNFAVNLLRRAFERNLNSLDDFYRRRLFANEIMLMPYYIASLNIEREYYELTGKVESFPGLCFVDTLDLTEERQLPSAMISEENSERVNEQQKAKINVIIGNPPYNVGQFNENDNNKNRKYAVIDQRIRETYAKDSQARLKAKISDAYVKFFRWATDRLEGRDGIVCYVSNNSFIDTTSFDGFRKHLLQDFQRVYHLDLGGNIRKNRPGRTISNVFDIRVGVGITIAIRSSKYADTRLFYHQVPDTWSKTQKLTFLDEKDFNEVDWKILKPNQKHIWLISNIEAEFETYLPIGSKAAKRTKLTGTPKAIFKTYSLGVSTNRDYCVYDFEYDPLTKRMRQFIENYNAEVDRYKRQNPKPNIDNFVNYDRVKWSSTLKQNLKRENYAVYDPAKIRNGLYRPFTKKPLYYAKPLIDRPGQFKNFFPNQQAEAENRIICVASVGIEKPFYSIVVDSIPNLAFVGFGGACQCFPFYTYDEDSGSRRENITDWALAQFRGHYGDETISKWDIFYYVYGLLHHPRYRERYALDLKRQLPRIPYAPDFQIFYEAGQELADLHLNYEDGERYKLRQIPVKKPISYKVSKMRPKSKRDSKTGNYKVYDMLEYNDRLTLRGIPERAFAYRLGNRSALEWIVDQYRVKTDKRSGITHDPNGYSDSEKYIVELLERVIWVSLRTVDIVERLEKLPFRDDSPTP